MAIEIMKWRNNLAEMAEAMAQWRNIEWLGMENEDNVESNVA